MSDLEQLLPGRLHALADDLAPAGDLAGRASAARSRHRQQRRTRLGLVAVAAAVLAVVLGVPTALGSFSRTSGAQVATPGTAAATSSPTPADTSAAEAQARARLAAASAAAQSASAAADPDRMDRIRLAPAAQAVIDAEVSRGVAETADAITRLHSAVRLASPAAGAPCPDGAAAAISRGLGIHVAYEQGALDEAPSGCEWSSDGDAAASSPSEDRLTVGVAYAAGPVQRVLDALERVQAVAEPGRCLTVLVPAVAPGATLQRCANGDGVGWSVYLPDRAGTGTWVLGAQVGDHTSADGVAGLVQVAALATANWGG